MISSIDGATGAVSENSELVFTAAGQEVLVCSGPNGAKNWEAGAYSPVTNTMYMPLQNVCARMLSTAPGDDLASALYGFAFRTQIAPGTDQVGTVQAISAETGETTWTYEQRAATMSLVATGGGLVFGGDVNGRFRALDHETGDVLWEINLGSAVSGFPITYAVDGRQFVAVSTGHATFHQLDARVAPERGQQPVRVRPAGPKLSRHKQLIAPRVNPGGTTLSPPGVAQACRVGKSCVRIRVPVSIPGGGDMCDRSVMSSWAVAVLAFAVMLPHPVTAQSSTGWSPPRTADGQPDLQGVWDFRTLTPLQRPTERGGPGRADG